MNIQEEDMNTSSTWKQRLFLILPILIVGILLSVGFIGAVFSSSLYISTPMRDAPDFSFYGLDGNPSTLSAFLGQQPVLLEFFEISCIPCKEQPSHISTLLSSHPNITVLSISASFLDTIPALQAHATTEGMTWIVGKNINGVEKFQVAAVPALFFITVDGKISYESSGLTPSEVLENWALNPENIGSTISTDPLTYLIINLSAIGMFFFGGLATALSPCLFPLLPLAIFRMQRFKRGRLRAIIGATLLVSGILISYYAFFLLAKFIGNLLFIFFVPVSLILGVVLIISGIIMLVPKFHEQLGRIKTPSSVNSLMSKNEYSALELFVVGLLFSIVAIPCSGALSLGLVIFAAVQNISGIFFALCLLAFSIAMLLPYLLLALLAEEARIRLATFFAKYSRFVQIGASFALILMGGLVLIPVFLFLIPNILSLII